MQYACWKKSTDFFQKATTVDNKTEQNQPPGHRMFREVLSYENDLYHISFHYAGAAGPKSAAAQRCGGGTPADAAVDGRKRLWLLSAAKNRKLEAGGVEFAAEWVILSKDLRTGGWKGRGGRSVIYLDNGATTLHKPPQVHRAVIRALETCANPGRGGHAAAMRAAEEVFRCRETAGTMFGCSPEQVVFTSNCTHGLNIAINTLVKPGAKVLISGFEHNAVTRPLHRRKADIRVAARQLFNWDSCLESFEEELRKGVDVAVFTHVSNVFGYILPVDEMAGLCRKYGVPFAVDAAQSAGMLPVDLGKWSADFIAMPGHKGLLGPQGTGILLCGRLPEPLICGGTGSVSQQQQMPDFLPDRAEGGTLNVPGIAGLEAGMRCVCAMGPERLLARQQRQVRNCAAALKRMGYRTFDGAHQGGTLSFLGNTDCLELSEKLGRRGVALRAGLHCAPLAHESAGTLETGTLRISFGHDASDRQTEQFLRILAQMS